MKNIKNFIKEHKKEILLIGGTIIVVGGCILIFKKVPVELEKAAKDFTITAVPNDKMNTVDLFARSGSYRDHMWVLNPVEAKALVTELEDSIACLKK